MKNSKIIIIAVVVLFVAASAVGAFMMLKADAPKYDVDQINQGGDWKQVSNEIFISAGEYARVNMVLVVSKGEAAVIDTGAAKSEATRVSEYIQNNHLKLSKVFITHKHADHIANLGMFEVGDENLYSFDNTQDNQVIQMGDRHFKVLHTPGHYNDQHISIELVEEHILVAGDVVPTNLPPLINYGGDGKTLTKTLERIKDNKYALIIPGHGDLLDAKRTVGVQLEYLKNAEALIKKMIASGKSLDEVKKIKLDQCIKGPSGITAAGKSEHMNAIAKLYYEVKAEMKNAGKNK